MQQQNRALLLDKNYIALSVVTWKKALKLLVNGKAEAVHDGQNIKLIPYARGNFSIPSVIRLLSPVPWKAHPTSIKFTRKNVIIRDDFNCQYCGEKVSKGEVTIDHIVPTSRGGQSSFTNCVVCCMRCNNEKGNKTPAEANMTLLYKPGQPSFAALYRNYLTDLPEEWKIYIMGMK